MGKYRITTHEQHSSWYSSHIRRTSGRKLSSQSFNKRIHAHSRSVREASKCAKRIFLWILQSSPSNLLCNSSLAPTVFPFWRSIYSFKTNRMGRFLFCFTSIIIFVREIYLSPLVIVLMEAKIKEGCAVLGHNPVEVWVYL